MSQNIDKTLYKIAASVAVPAGIAALGGLGMGTAGYSLAAGKSYDNESAAERRQRLREAAITSGLLGTAAGAGVATVAAPSLRGESTKEKILKHVTNAGTAGLAYGAVPVLANNALRTLAYNVIDPDTKAMAPKGLRYIGQHFTSGTPTPSQINDTLNRKGGLVLADIDSNLRTALQNSYEEARGGVPKNTFKETLRTALGNIAHDPDKELQNLASRIKHPQQNLTGNKKPVVDTEALAIGEELKKRYGVDVLDQKIGDSDVLKLLRRQRYEDLIGGYGDVRPLIGIDKAVRNITDKKVLKEYDALTDLDALVKRTAGIGSKAPNNITTDLLETLRNRITPKSTPTTRTGKLLESAGKGLNTVRDSLINKLYQDREKSLLRLWNAGEVATRGPIMRNLLKAKKLAVPTAAGLFLSPQIYKALKD
jgi:hypothetical protein